MDFIKWEITIGVMPFIIDSSLEMKGKTISQVWEQYVYIFLAPNTIRFWRKRRSPCNPLEINLLLEKFHRVISREIKRQLVLGEAMSYQIEHVIIIWQKLNSVKMIFV
jgi:hypothetical protein